MNTITTIHADEFQKGDYITVIQNQVLDDRIWVLLVCFIIRCRLPKKKQYFKITEISNFSTMDIKDI